MTELRYDSFGNIDPNGHMIHLGNKRYADVDYAIKNGLRAAADDVEWRPSQRKTAALHSRNVLQGYIPYNRLFWKDNKFYSLVAGCFAKSIESVEIKLLLDHEPVACIGSTSDDALEVFDHDQKGLAWRAHLPNTPQGKYAQQLALDKTYTAASPGFYIKRSEPILVSNRPVNFIFEAKIDDISLVSAGQIEEAFFVLVDNKRGSLETECKSGELLNDGSFVMLLRNMRKFGNACFG